MDNKKRSNPTNNPIQISNAFEHYGLNEKSQHRDKVPAWMEDVITKRKESPKASDFKGIWP